jgi:DNA invertase Pin-like site-specific DNA recombinase
MGKRGRAGKRRNQEEQAMFDFFMKTFLPMANWSRKLIQAQIREKLHKKRTRYPWFFP